MTMRILFTMLWAAFSCYAFAGAEDIRSRSRIVITNDAYVGVTSEVVPETEIKTTAPNTATSGLKNSDAYDPRTELRITPRNTTSLVQTQSTPVSTTVNEISQLSSKESLTTNWAANPLAVAKVDALLPEFSINAGERLKPTLTRWLSSIGYTLAWDAVSNTPGRIRDIVYPQAMTRQYNTIQELLLELLDGYSLKVFVSEQERKVVVRNEDNSTR